MVNFPAFVHHNNVDGALGCPRLETILCRLLKAPYGKTLGGAPSTVSHLPDERGLALAAARDGVVSVQPEPAVDHPNLSRIDQFGMVGAPPAPNPGGRGEIWLPKRRRSPQTKPLPKE
jgi:hypothetical protein